MNAISATAAAPLTQWDILSRRCVSDRWKV